MTSVEATFSAANVLLVIDESSRMDDQPEGFELKKWDALKAALEPALTAVQDEMNFGLLLPVRRAGGDPARPRKGASHLHALLGRR